MSRRARTRSWLPCALIAGGLSVHAFTTWGWRASQEATTPRVAQRAVSVEEPETATEVSLLPGERYIASNRFSVREGADAAFEQRWAQRKSSLLSLPGFRWFSLMRRVPSEDAPPFPDDYSYISFTIWETKKDFNFWRKGPAFKEAHGGGGILDFLGMIMSSFMTSKGPPKPFFWEGVLPVSSPEQRDRLLSGPGGRPDADGETMLEPEVFVATTRFQVAGANDFEEFWAQQSKALEGSKGFRFAQLLRRDQVPDDDCNYLGVTVWDDRDAFEKAGLEMDPGDLLTRPAMNIFYEGKLVLESESGP